MHVKSRSWSWDRALARLAVLLCIDAVGVSLATAAAPSNVVGTLSTRAHVGSGPNTLLSGLFITGSDPKQVLIRGLGPSLSVSAPLADPTIEVRDSSGMVAGSNNNWKDSQESQIVATGHAPSQDAESALLITLPPGFYTVRLSGVNDGTGVGKIDLIDVDDSVPSNLNNISSRAVVSPGENVLVGGFVINGPQNRKVIIRGIGPSLTQLGVDGAMPNPTLVLRDSSGNALVFNDDWEDTQRDEIIDSTLPPGDRRESAIAATLAPGSYTAELIGACRGSGVAAVEVFDFGPGGVAVAVPPSSPAPTCFPPWALEHGLTGPAAAPTADPDRDDIPNLLEYALGKNPNVPDAPATTGGIVEVQGQKYLSLTLTQPTGDDVPSDVAYTIERATVLAPANWSGSPNNWVVQSITPGPGALETVTVRSTSSMTGTPMQFLRLRVTLIAP